MNTLKKVGCNFFDIVSLSTTFQSKRYNDVMGGRKNLWIFQTYESKLFKKIRKQGVFVNLEDAWTEDGPSVCDEHVTTHENEKL